MVVRNHSLIALVMKGQIKKKSFILIIFFLHSTLKIEVTEATSVSLSLELKLSQSC